jgi:hypothetical protein
MDLLTTVPDQDPDIDHAADLLHAFGEIGAVAEIRPAAAMGDDAVEFTVRPQDRAWVIQALNARGFRIVEGGQR